MNGEGIIVPLDRRFVVYPGAARVDQGAGVVCPGSCDMLIEKLKKFTIGNLSPLSLSLSLICVEPIKKPLLHLHIYPGAYPSAGVDLFYTGTLFYPGAGTGQGR